AAPPSTTWPPPPDPAGRKRPAGPGRFRPRRARVGRGGDGSVPPGRAVGGAQPDRVAPRSDGQPELLDPRAASLVPPGVRLLQFVPQPARPALLDPVLVEPRPGRGVGRGDPHHRPLWAAAQSEPPGGDHERQGQRDRAVVSMWHFLSWIDLRRITLEPHTAEGVSWI